MIEIKKEYVENLKQLAKQAIQKGELQAEQKAKEQAEKDQAEILRIEKVADEIIQKIPEIIQSAAANGHKSVAVKRISHKDCSDKVPKGSQLRYVAKFVWVYCAEAQLSPTIEEFYDDSGYQSGYAINVNW